MSKDFPKATYCDDSRPGAMQVVGSDSYIVVAQDDAHLDELLSNGCRLTIDGDSAPTPKKRGRKKAAKKVEAE